MTTPSISVATSVVPGRDIELQAKALTSWAKLGLKVVSVNAAHEVERVKAEHPQLNVTTAKKTAEKIAGKPLPFIKDLFDAAQNNAPDAPVIGVINADIILRDLTDLKQTIGETASTAVVMLARVDLPDIKSCNSFEPTGTEKYSVGYDGVFMHRATAFKIPDSIFCIGMPFWDYWLPLMTLLQGEPLKTLASPVALHVDHPTRWDKSVYVFFHALVSDMMKVLDHERSTMPTPALEIVSDILQHSYNDIFQRATSSQGNEASMETLASFYDRIQEVIVHHIKSKAQPVAVPGAQ